MTPQKSLFVSLFLAFTFLLPSPAQASQLSTAQANAIIELLQAFNADQSVVATVRQILGLSAPSPATTQPSIPRVLPTGSPYTSSTLGFDISFATSYYPAESFGFAIIGVTRGKAFIGNPRFASEYAWAKFGSASAPTLYMNLNAPYGSTVLANIGTPRTCPARAAGGSATSTEPTACEGYNYGYNAAKDAYAYAKGAGAESPLWWLDIEEANSWSADTAVNDATIQGAIDYLNTQNIRVGIYSMHYMWNDIAGKDFVPTQVVNGQQVSIPNWLPVGIKTLVGAINACVISAPFIKGSPIWLIQYVANSTAIDQNVAC